jgi:hypothetical protein
MKSILLTILLSFAITAHAEELYHSADTNQDWKPGLVTKAGGFVKNLVFV